MSKTTYTIRCLLIEDFDEIIKLWESIGMSARALNPVDDSRDGISRYLRRNPSTCFCAVTTENGNSSYANHCRIVGVILAGHDGRRGLVHHLAVHPNFRNLGIAGNLVHCAEEALLREDIHKIMLVVFNDNDGGNAFWESQGYTLRTNLNYRNKSLSPDIPQGK